MAYGWLPALWIDHQREPCESYSVPIRSFTFREVPSILRSNGVKSSNASMLSTPMCDFPHNLTNFVKHNLATQGHHSCFQRKQAVNALKDILTASFLCEA